MSMGYNLITGMMLFIQSEHWYLILHSNQKFQVICKSENTDIFHANPATITVISSSAIKSSRQSVNKIEDKTEPCLTPLVAPKGSDTAFSTLLVSDYLHRHFNTLLNAI